MKNILVICGAEKAGHSEGRYNRSLTEAAVSLLSSTFSVVTTYIEEGYDIEAEQEKFKQTDSVIWQFPVFWFHCPSSMKQYLDRVFVRGVFFERRVPYGTGGLMGGRTYLLSSTWNAPKEAFNDPGTFYEGCSVDDALIAMHKANQYVGMTPLPSFTVHNVIADPRYEENEARWLSHLQRVYAL
ncbi:MAG: NAD(P)H-dependent oxidoreductase [Gammaproteobacteria bacterium]